MPRLMPAHELDAIASLVALLGADHPEGVSIQEIRDRLDFTLPPRTFQRRLKRLVEQGRIQSRGCSKGMHYFPCVASQEEPQSQTVVSGIKLSAVSAKLRNHVHQSKASRSPVGYEVEFLNSYVPNETAYLSSDTMAKLAEIGDVGIGNLPAGTYLRQLMDRLLIDLSWNSSRLEGNTYSLLETQRLLDLGEVAEGRGSEEAQMILNHKAAIEMLSSQSEVMDFNAYTICNLHALLSDNLLQDHTACGRIRKRAVGIAGSVFYPLENPQLIQSQFDTFLHKAQMIEDPFEQAFFAMVHIPYLQPFEDVNKRVSRLAANISLMKHNLCPLSFVDVPQDEYVHGLLAVYELNKVEYLRDVFVWSYERSAGKYSAIRQTLGEPDPYRLRYRLQMQSFVNEIVHRGMKKDEAIKWIAIHTASDIPEVDRTRFIEIVEIELSSLHVGNIARYRLSSNAFQAWFATW